MFFQLRLRFDGFLILMNFLKITSLLCYWIIYGSSPHCPRSVFNLQVCKVPVTDGKPSYWEVGPYLYPNQNIYNPFLVFLSYIHLIYKIQLFKSKWPVPVLLITTYSQISLTLVLNSLFYYGIILDYTSLYQYLVNLSGPFKL